MENIDRQTASAMPRINEPAPAFEARTTHGVKRLEDYRGKWLVLFSHHADFRAVNTELLGLSIDRYYSHVA